MTEAAILGGVLLVVVAIVVAIRRRRRTDAESAYGHWQREQTVLWHGRPVTVTFDYAPYLREPSRRRVNVHTLQRSRMGESSVVGLCHDSQEEQVFKLGSIQGEVLIQRSGESMSVEAWVELMNRGEEGTSLETGEARD